MSEYTYTAEDFEQAQFAIDPSKDDPAGRCWTRWHDDSLPWGNGNGAWRSDYKMVSTGCIPVYAEPYSSEALQRAWEHGEEPGPGERATEGMVTISRSSVRGGTVSLHVNVGGGPLYRSEDRIIYRPPAPEPDPVADLAQAMEDVLPEEAGSPVALRRYAEALVEHGVRVTDDE